MRNETKENSTVTRRFRDSMEQVRLSRAELAERPQQELRRINEASREEKKVFDSFLIM
ncbi:MAG: hypothetical protein LBV68_07690 [Spirochaetaceae bacterium]|nr:hypothetical protein [Spirochaetaceae bacterium]